MKRAGRAAALLCAACLSAAPAALAQKPEPPSPAAQEEGRQHFQRGVEFFKEGDYRAALAEFKRSYEIAPSYRILYNVGQANNGLQDYAGALRAFERYLAEGGDEIDAERRAQVQSEVRKLRARVASLTIEVNVPGAEVFVDDVSVGLSPLGAPVLVSAGARKVGAVKPPMVPASRVVELVGGDAKRVALALVAPEAASKPGPSPRPGQAAAQPSHAPFWIALAATAALGVGTAVTGVLALQERRSLDDAFEGTDGKAIDDARSRARTFAVTTDVLGAATLVAGGTTLYFALRPAPKATTSARATPIELGLKPGGAALRLSF
jgi:tetratricopeptide (TPR) repeat protein